MQRRMLIKAGTAIACPLCVGLATRRAFGSETAGHWSYAGDTGPDRWGSLSPDYAACADGIGQSPIDLSDAIRAEIPPADIAWQAMDTYGVLNNGHTIQVNAPGGNRVTVLGKPFSLLQFHFHHSSEHTIDGTQFPLEAHFVHRSDDQSLSVIGVMIDEGAENAALATIWSLMPHEESEIEITNRPLDPNALLPGSRSAYLYYGSLTTPPCSEVVTWVVLDTPVTASASQIAAFADLFPGNFRPVQPLNRRLLLFGG